MKKFILLFLALTLALSSFASCGRNNNQGQTGGNPVVDTPKPDDNKPNIPDNSDNNNSNLDSTELCVLNSTSASVTATETAGAIALTLTDSKGSEALIVRVPVDSSWDTVKITQGNTVKYAKVYEKSGVSIVDFSMLPNATDATVSPEILKGDKALVSSFGNTLANGVKVDTNYYPGFVRKAVTFTIDDGKLDLDSKFLEIVGPAGFLGTFNLNRVTDASTLEYLSLYSGYEVANHHQLHAIPFRETADFHTGKSFESLIKNEIWNSATADTEYVYLTTTDGLYYINYHYYAPSMVGQTKWMLMATDETYIQYAEITKENIEAVFGEGSVVGFAYPNGILSDSIKQYLQAAGYLYARKTGNLKDTTGFALPSDRFAWTYNADVNCLLEVMASYDAYADDGQLKMFAFGVHSKDFETAEGGWDTLREFANLYGNRSDDFYYAANRAIFEYEDAVKALIVNENGIINNSDIAVFVTVNDEKVVVPAKSIYYFDGRVEASVVFDANNGTEAQTQFVSSCGKLTKPADPEKSGFVFEGWYFGDKKWNFDDIIVEGMTLTANFVADAYAGPTAEVLSAKGGATGIVALIHDDGTPDTGIVLDRLYLKYGLVGDVALYAKNALATYDKWNAILGTGRWGVISHSTTHTWWGTVTKDVDGNITSRVIDEKKMFDEIVNSQTTLRNLFPDYRVLTFAWPGFSDVTAGLTMEQWLDTVYSAEARALIDQYYIAARNYRETSPSYVTEDAIWNYMDGYFLTPTLINSAGDSGLKSRLESAANDGRILLLSVHKVSDDVAEGDWSTGVLSSVDMEKALVMVNQYVDSGKVWNAHYEDAILYVREAQTAKVTVSGDENGITVILTDEMDNTIYNYPLTVRVDVPGTWKAAKITQGDRVSYATATYADGRFYIDADIVPDGGEASIEAIDPKDIPYVPAETEKPTPNFDSLVPEVYDDDEIITEGATITSANVSSANVTIVEDNGNSYLEYDKSGTAAGNQLIFNSLVSVEDGELLVFETKIRHTHISDSNSCSYFNFYDASGTKIGGNYFFNAGKGSEISNVTFDGTNTGIGEGEWFTLTFKFTENTLEVLVNGTTLKTLTIDGVENVAQIRIRSDAAMQHKTDVDNVKFVAEEIVIVTPDPVKPEDFEGMNNDTAWAPEMTDEVKIQVVSPGASDSATIRYENGNKYLEYIKGTSGKKGIIELWNKSSDVEDNLAFSVKIRFNDASNVNFANFFFYTLENDTYKTPYYPSGSSSSPYYVSVDDNGNITLGGKDTGVKEGEWFTLAFKITTDTLKVYVNGALFQTFTVSGIQNVALIRLQSGTSDRLYKVDLDDVYVGPYDETEEEQPKVEIIPEDFENEIKDTAWDPSMTDDLTIKTVNQGASDSLTVREEGSNNYLEYIKNTTSKGIFEFWNTSDVSGAVIFQAKMRVNDASNVNFATFMFYTIVDGAYKTPYYPSGSNNYYLSVNDSGNVTLAGKDTGVAKEEWFTIAFRIETDTLKVFINGNVFQTYTVSGIQSVSVIRLQSVSNDRLYKIDFDDVYYGAAPEEVVEPANKVDFESFNKDAAWEITMTEDVTIKNYYDEAATATVREENGNKYLEYDKNSTSKGGIIEFLRTSEVTSGAFVFEADVRLNHNSETLNCSYFQFYSYVDGSYKTQYTITNKFFSVEQSEDSDATYGNVVIAGKDTGIAEDEWFTLKLRFTTDTLEIYVNGELLETCTVSGIQNTAVIRFRSDATMLHKTDFDDVYFGAEIK